MVSTHLKYTFYRKGTDKKGEGEEKGRKGKREGRKDGGNRNLETVEGDGGRTPELSR